MMWPSDSISAVHILQLFGGFVSVLVSVLVLVLNLGNSKLRKTPSGRVSFFPHSCSCKSRSLVKTFGGGDASSVPVLASWIKKCRQLFLDHTLDHVHQSCKPYARSNVQFRFMPPETGGATQSQEGVAVDLHLLESLPTLVILHDVS
jgi:hypothetical protein